MPIPDVTLILAAKCLKCGRSYSTEGFQLEAVDFGAEGRFTIQPPPGGWPVCHGAPCAISLEEIKACEPSSTPG